jgi:uncharacterized membrane protein
MHYVKLGLRILLGVFMILAGVRHFTHPDFYLQLMPPYIPAHKLMVDLSGVAEVVLGIGLLVPHAMISRLSAWGIIALLIAIFPANIHVYLHREEIFPDVPAALHLIRLPLQGLLILWAWWFTRPPRGETPAASNEADAS